MTTSVYGQVKAVSSTAGILPIDNGGTLSTTAAAAAASLHLVTTDMINVAKGVVKLNSAGKVDKINTNSFNVHLTGPNTVNTNGKITIWISDYDDFTTYTVSSSTGVVKRVKDIIQFTAPATPGPVMITVNDRQIIINVTGFTDLTIKDGNLTPHVSKAGLNFGYRLTLSKNNNILVVAAILDPTDSEYLNPMVEAGAVYVFEKTSTGWLEIQKITPKHRETLDQFGTALAVDYTGDTIVIGSQKHTKNSINGDTKLNSGAAWVFIRNPVSKIYEENAKLTAARW